MGGELQQQAQPVQPEEVGFFEGVWEFIKTKGLWIAGGFIALAGGIANSDEFRKSGNKALGGDDEHGVFSTIAHFGWDAPKKFITDLFNRDNSGTAEEWGEEIEVFGKKIMRPTAYFKNDEIFDYTPDEINELRNFTVKLKDIESHSPKDIKDTYSQDLYNFNGKRERLRTFASTIIKFDRESKKYRQAVKEINDAEGVEIKLPSEFGLESEVDALLTDKEKTTIAEYGTVGNNDFRKKSTIEQIISLDRKMENIFVSPEFKTHNTTNSSFWHNIELNDFSTAGDNIADSYGVKDFLKAGGTGVASGAVVGAIAPEFTDEIVTKASKKIARKIGGRASAALIGGAMTGGVVTALMLVHDAYGAFVMTDPEKEMKDKIKEAIDSGNLGDAANKAQAAKELFRARSEDISNTGQDKINDQDTFRSFEAIEKYISDLSQRKEIIPIIEKTYGKILDKIEPVMEDMAEFDASVELAIKDSKAHASNKNAASVRSKRLAKQEQSAPPEEEPKADSTPNVVVVKKEAGAGK